MSHTHDIDNEEPLFQFDAYGSLRSNNYLALSARGSEALPACTLNISSHISALHASPTWDQELPLTVNMGCSSSADNKGKGVSQPMPIHSRISGDEQTMFSMSLGSTSSSPDGIRSPPSTSFALSSVDSPSPLSPPTADSADDDDDSDTAEVHVGSAIAKGKAREQPPTLPPLSFLATELSYNTLDWPTLDLSTSIPGSSSYGSTYGSLGSADPAQGASTGGSESASPEPPEACFAVARVPSRRRSLSALSVRSNHSLSAISMSKVKVKLATAKTPGNLARKLLFSKKREGSPPSAGPSATICDVLAEPEAVVSGCGDLSQTNCLMPWSRDLKLRTPPLATPTLENGTAYSGVDSFPVYCAGRSSDNSVLRTKGRSYSSPLPLPSTALDLIPVTTADIFSPVTAPTPSYFDEWLPRELRLQVLAALVELFDTEHRTRIQQGKWSVLKAASSKNKWVGRDKGLRELFKLSRVSKAWQGLVFDGQLWVKLDLRSFPRLPSDTLSRLSKTAGAFIRELDLAGHTDLSSSLLFDISLHLSIAHPAFGNASRTNLTYINLQGCAALTTRSLHYLLSRSPEVQTLCLKGVSAVTNATCDEVLSVHCPVIISLDLSRCSNLTGEGIKSLAYAALARKEPLRLKELRLTGLKRITDDMMVVLGKAAPNLEVLDLSYARDLHNSAIEAFVACNEKDAANFEVVQLTAREAGRDSTDMTKYWRRVTHLKHLCLSSCSMLTDHACSHLAHTVPRLELLELAGIGEELRDDGLVRLLKTTPFIRKLDLEDASEITDNVLDVLTPFPVAGAPSSSPPPPQPGHALEHLTISYAGELTNEALIELVRECPRLRVLEADNTRMSGSVVKEFVQRARARKLAGARVAAIDCRGVGEYSVKDLAPYVRPRHGCRGWDTRKLGFLDARDDEGLGVGQDECDELRVVLKTFYSWQTVDAVRAAREKRRKASGRRSANASGSSEELAPALGGRTRWWAPGGRRSGAVSPLMLDMNNDNDREGCMIM
ncbi:RNI-like protein [Obba rivulosa]|uniref:RNI-like protein n=1 Tax=Obba rivulosa TaxID=1052685 RepID=A0A8E2J6E4_9APHY|nr:RNI-like protein [Obba rivulosa]